MNFLNRYSFVLITILAVTAITGYAVWRADIALGVVALVLAATLTVFWVATRRGVPVPANPEKRIQRARTEGRPLVVHFFSDFCIRCLVQRLMAARVEQAFRGRCEFLYIDVNNSAAVPVMEALNAKLGDYVLFDQQGKAAGKTSRLTSECISALWVKRAQ